MQSIAAGLFFLHDLNTAHLDMKSANVLIGKSLILSYLYAPFLDELVTKSICMK